MFKVLEVVAAVVVPLVILKDIRDNPSITPSAQRLWAKLCRRATALTFSDIWFLESRGLLWLIIDVAGMAFWASVLYTEWLVYEAVDQIAWGPTDRYASVQTLVERIANQVSCCTFAAFKIVFNCVE